MIKGCGARIDLRPLNGGQCDAYVVNELVANRGKGLKDTNPNVLNHLISNAGMWPVQILGETQCRCWRNGQGKTAKHGATTKNSVITMTSGKSPVYRP